jgi:hypothetical protein
LRIGPVSRVTLATRIGGESLQTQGTDIGSYGKLVIIPEKPAQDLMLVFGILAAKAPIALGETQ